jgi:S-adenosylmethionine hydrolase
MEQAPMITLTTDFDLGFYVGAMKGAMYTIHEEATIEDVTHQVPAQDVVSGALAMRAACPLYPDGSVHVGVVDPGVGTDRDGLLVECEEGYLVGPDNGLLTLAMEALEPTAIYRLQNRDLWRDDVSSTFHGRDVFGPVAAHVAAGVDPAEAGPEITAWEDLDLPGPKEVEEGLEVRVIAVDPFGNCILNVPGDPARRRLGKHTKVMVDIDDRTVGLPYVDTYSDAPPDEALLLVGSTEFMEIGVNRGSAADRFGLEPGDEVRLHLP